MNNQYLRIGGGPDFLMTVGKMMHSHHAEFDLAFASGAVFRAPATNASLGALIKEIHGKMDRTASLHRKCVRAARLGHD